MVESIAELAKALNHLTWPGAFAFGCFCFMVVGVLYVIFKN